jgi:DNA recombination protein RmuC
MDSMGMVALSAFVAVAALAWAAWMHRQATAERRTHEGLLATLRQQLAQASADAARLPDALERLRAVEADLARLNSAAQDAAGREASLSAQLDAATTQARATADERDQLRRTLEQARTEAARLAAAHAQVEAKCEAAETAHAQTRKYLDDAETRLRTVFVEAASKVFDEKSMALDQRIRDSGDASRQGLEATLKPFAERIGQFQSRLEQLSGDQAKETASLVGTIGELKSLNQGMADATSGLTRALKGNAKTRGDWGELILDTVLKASGLEEGRNFTTQSSATDDDTGQRGRPDVVVNLPDGRQVVIDSKVNLIAWSDHVNAETPQAAQDALVRHTAALRQHVRDLADKNYPRLLGPNALDMTILFVPIEGALASALAFNHDLQTEAFDKRIVFASPNTLMAMLRVVERLWLRDKVQKQVDIIGTEAGKLVDALTSFLGEFNAIEKKLESANTAFRDARNALQDSPQSVVARARRLVEAGAKGKKAIPEELRPVSEQPPLSLLPETPEE